MTKVARNYMRAAERALWGRIGVLEREARRGNTEAAKEARVLRLRLKAATARRRAEELLAIAEHADAAGRAG